MSMYDIVLLIFTVYVLFPVQLSFLVLIIIENLYNSKKIIICAVFHVTDTINSPKSILRLLSIPHMYRVPTEAQLRSACNTITGN